MKTILASIVLVVLCVGCVTNLTDKQVLIKSTVFGIQCSSSPVSGLGSIVPTVQCGLVRNEYLSNPTHTNQTYCAPIATHVVANLNMLSQSANEDLSTK